MTLDHAVLDNCRFNGRQGIGIEVIQGAIRDFAAYYRQEYVPKFVKPTGCVESDCPNALWMGGNAGYFSKTLAYPYWKDQALGEVSDYMALSFPRHGHRSDREQGISPHTMSYARCNGKLYPMGLCEVEIT